MKSSTIRRSTLSRESMEVIENLSKEQEQDGLLGEYVRPDDVQAKSESSVKSQEIDLLWQTFKSTQFNTNSPIAYILLGFIIGVITTLVIGGFFVMNPKSHSGIGKVQQNLVQEQTLEQQAEEVVNTGIMAPAESDNLSLNEQQNVDSEQNQAPVASSIDTSNMKKYIVKSGDTVEGIIKKHYGTYSPEKAELIMKANNLESLDRLQIDQELLIPAP